MRAYKIEGAGAVRFAGSMAQARAERDELVTIKGVRKKDIKISEEIEIPTNKTELIQFLNEELSAKDVEI